MCLELVNEIDHFWVGQPIFEESTDWKGPGGQRGVLLPQGKMESMPEILGPCLITHRNLRVLGGERKQTAEKSTFSFPLFRLF